MNVFKRCPECGFVYVISEREDGKGKRPGYCPDCYIRIKAGLPRGFRLPSRILVRVKK